MNNDVLDYLKVCHEQINSIPIEIRREVTFLGDSSKDWFQGVDVNWKPNHLSSNKLNRNDLIYKRNQLKSQKEVSDIDIRIFIIDILAWGAKRFYKQKVMSTIESFEGICRSLLEDKISTLDAYEEFYEKYYSGKMLGLGPAYYTKLICFFGD